MGKPPITFLLLSVFTIRSFGQNAARSPQETVQHPGAQEENSPEMKRIFDEDQADRQMNLAAMTLEQRLDWSNKVGPRDAQRRKQVLDLISRGTLHTGEDFDHAAFVFQHGEEPRDFLLAHTLALVAIAKGSAKSRWIAAATLDRYLQKVQQPQIYGTQYFIGPNKGDQLTQEPYDRGLIPDSLRAAVCVPDQAAQQQVLELFKQGKEPPESKKPPGCR
jgi:hypothetical protein